MLGEVSVNVLLSHADWTHIKLKLDALVKYLIQGPTFAVCFLRYKVVLRSVLDRLVRIVIGLNVFLSAQGNFLSLHRPKLVESESEEDVLGKSRTHDRRGSLESFELKHDHVGTELIIEFYLQIDLLAEEPGFF